MSDFLFPISSHLFVCLFVLFCFVLLFFCVCVNAVVVLGRGGLGGGQHFFKVAKVMLWAKNNNNNNNNNTLIWVITSPYVYDFYLLFPLFFGGGERTGSQYKRIWRNNFLCSTFREGIGIQMHLVQELLFLRFLSVTRYSDVSSVTASSVSTFLVGNEVFRCIQCNSLLCFYVSCR